ncbi:thiolase family protein [Arthrobacter sp. I2-34]|uniref:Thiolase family protein n=1 Tax=Arthrobacter hankyongi TaxID=2904801 RepID=A0ABS9L5Y1_9MICC|nr:thiolase family protein [Arthrobacter hankyongi]MCG2622080.1 thiolase family protein [Arthrobacter hankyongi]
MCSASPHPERDPVVVLGRRSAFGRLNGIWARTTAGALLAPVLSAVVRDAGLPPAEIDDVVIGNAVGGGGNVARLALLDAGLPETVPGMTVDRQCGSGLDAVVLACRLVAAGAGQLYLAGGVESCSTAPLRAHRLTSTPGAPDFYGRAPFAPQSLGDPDMGVAAEAVAARWNVSRADQDAFALRSHQRALAAAAEGAFDEEIVPVGGAAVGDEGPRKTIGPALLGRFPAAFVPSGTVTAGNSCADADGAAVVLVASRAAAGRLGFGGGLGFRGAATAGTDPNLPGIGGGRAGARLLAEQGLHGTDLGRVEFNEAFAAQALASLRMLGVAPERANRQGGALAFGHPYGASGAFLVLRLLQQERSADRDRRPALAAASIAGGMGTAALFGWTDPR